MSACGLVLTTNHQRLPARGWTELEMNLELRNDSADAVDIYPGVAQLACRSGWVGPSWDVALTSGGVGSRLRELRTYYGPPGMPPNAAYYETGRLRVAAGRSHVTSLHWCFIPHADVPAVSLEQLDPQGMDGLTEAELSGCSVLVYGSPGAVRARARERLLRPGIVAFVATGGPLELQVSYRQTRSGAFAPREPMTLHSNRLAIALDGN